jgi:hypothetical protein
LDQFMATDETVQWIGKPSIVGFIISSLTPPLKFAILFAHLLFLFCLIKSPVSSLVARFAIGAILPLTIYLALYLTARLGHQFLYIVTSKRIWIRVTDDGRFFKVSGYISNPQSQAFSSTADKGRFVFFGFESVTKIFVRDDWFGVGDIAFNDFVDPQGMLLPESDFLQDGKVNKYSGPPYIVKTLKRPFGEWNTIEYGNKFVGISNVSEVAELIDKNCHRIRK